MATTFNPEVFREYDIRGVAGKDLSPEFAEQLGLAYAYLIKDRKPAKNRNKLTVSVGHDNRLSSDEYEKALVTGLTKGGLDVIRLGLCPTPVTYFSLFHLDLDGGIMITASHLPSDRNGFKICVGHDAIYGDKIQEIKSIMNKHLEPAPKGGQDSQYDILKPYMDYLKNEGKSLAAKKVVLDNGNGVSSLIAPKLFRDLGATVVELFSESDGHFPNHLPDTSVAANLKDLVAKVKSEKADFGIGYDGDADRVAVVDETGRILAGDELLIIFSRQILKEKPGAAVVSEVKASYRLFDDVKKNGGKAVMWKTGHSLIEAKMKELGAALGGEMSGHIFFADRYFGYDDAIYASLRMYEIASQLKDPLSSLISDLPKTMVTPEMRIPCDNDELKFKLVDATKTFLTQDPKVPKDKITTIDGIRIDFGDGWGLIRPSNTEPVLSLRFEAASQDRLNQIRGVFKGALDKAAAQLHHKTINF